MRNSSTICVDANLVVRYVTDPRDAAVNALWEQWDRDGVLFVAPVLLLYEVTNAIYRMNRNGTLSRTDADEALATAMSIPIQFERDPSDHATALRLAREYAMGASYDAHYLAVASRLGVHLWTADEKFVNAVRRRLSWVHLVGATAGSS
jgi:predicted nucleic acid-binding protein